MQISRRGHKYIMKRMVNGKWRYYYKDGGSDKYGDYNAITPEGSGDKVSYRKSNDLFTSTHSRETLTKNEHSTGIDGPQPTLRYREDSYIVNEGQLDRFVDSSISEFSKKTSQLQQAGKSFINKLFNR